LNQEYFYLSLFSIVFAIIIATSVDYVEMTTEHQPTNFPYTAVAFIIGASTSILAGYIGMRIAVYTNTRTTLMCCKGKEIEVYENGSSKKIKDLKDGFFTAFRGG
jgi:H+-translocating diphosphatase